MHFQKYKLKFQITRLGKHNCAEYIGVKGKLKEPLLALKWA
jgi:hypothetical protein